ncbi:flagellar hook protein FlgE [Azorhizobium doebereinerae]|uniref:flagellar hook protein FlgE n=1 Tax=Azorhizobium doebereinerae TaxID=281091 RepID=UPI00041AA9A5|nr:flagellar hook protein FlgE [Azorhizobium doebereinerae]
MSLYGTLRTSVSGMNAQSSKLGTISDNIANSSTTGYKKASTEFSSLIVDSGISEYNSGSVNTKIAYGVSEQGTTNNTTSNTDLMVSGDGFFVVQDTSGQTVLTRAGNFTVDASTGNLVNAAGYTLMAYDISGGQDPSVVVNGTGGLVPVNIGSVTLSAVPTTSGSITANLPSSSTVVAAASLPSTNAATAAYTQKSSVSTYDSLGNQVTLDVYLTKTVAADATASPPTVDTWEMAVYNQADATTGGTTSFPYSSAALATQTLKFDSSGQITSGTSTSFAIPGGSTVKLDTSKVTQLATSYSISATMNGSPPSAASSVKVNSDGTVYAVDGNGNTTNLYKIPLATVQSPDNLTPVAGNAYQVNQNSGALQLGFGGDAGFGSIKSNALENSTVDMASELTEMIVAQRDYTANSKVFQTGTELLDVLMSLKR